MFYIFDCNGTIVGNPKGYRDIKQATKQANMKGSKAYTAIWNAFWKACKENPYHEKVSCINDGRGWNDD